MKINLYILVYILLIKNNFYEFFLGDINDLNDEVFQFFKKMIFILIFFSFLGVDFQFFISFVDNVFFSSQFIGVIGEDFVLGDSKYICIKISLQLYIFIDFYRELNI